MKYVVKSQGAHEEWFYQPEFFEALEEAVARAAVCNGAMKPQYADFAVYKLEEVK